MKNKNWLLLLLLTTMPMCVFGQQSVKQNVITQMNYCISSLTNIINNKSMPVLEHESDQILNNLTMEQTIGVPEIIEFREELMDGIGKFEISEEERQIMRRLSSMKRDGQKWNALSNGLSQPIFVTGSQVGVGSVVQMAVQVLSITARTVVDYNQMLNESEQEELVAMWNLRKRDMETINALRKSALGIVSDLFEKYKLSEGDRLTEATAKSFSKYISESDVNKRIRILEDNHYVYKTFPDYYYYLGMAYLDAGNFAKAKENFQLYSELYSQAPILRYDEKSGCIALSRLAYERGLSLADKENLIQIVQKNLPHNSAAWLQCALTYIYDIRDGKKGLDMLRTALDDPEASDVAILYLAVAKLRPFMSQYPNLIADFNVYFQKANMDLSPFLLWAAPSKSSFWKTISNVISFDDFTSRRWYECFISRHFDNELTIVLPRKITLSGGTLVYVEKHNDDNLDISELTFRDTELITEDDINDVDCFKEQNELKYLFVEASENNDGYTLKANIDLDKIKRGEWPRMSEFSLTESDVDDIIDFCERYIENLHSPYNKYKCEEIDSDYVELDSIGKVQVNFKGKSLKYKPLYNDYENGCTFVRIMCKDGIALVYRYDEESTTLIPYAYVYGAQTIYVQDQVNMLKDALVREKSEEGFFVKILNWFKNIFSSSNEDEKVDKSEKEISASNEEDISWYEKIKFWE